jgi:ATP/maltotriose-dependent transcriptional regulator MalT
VLATHCLVAYGSVLATAGRLTEAEAVMTEALSASSSRNASHRLETTCNLARVRIEQGRIEEAAALLAPYEDRVVACEPTARLRLVTGEPELAAAAARRGLKELQGDVLRASKLVARLVEAEIALGHLDAAREAADELDALASRAGSPAVAGEAALARGRVAAARGEHGQAVASFDEAREIFRDRPFLEGTSRLALAESLAAAGDSPRAIDEARAAAAIFERIGATGGTDRAAAALRRLGAPTRTRSAEAQSRAVADLSGRELEVLDLIRQGSTNAEIASRLYISPKTAEHHVSRILAKLGVRTRAEAAALAAARAQ